MSEQATGPGVVEGGHLQKSLKARRMIMGSLDDAIEAGCSSVDGSCAPTGDA